MEGEGPPRNRRCRAYKTSRTNFLLKTDLTPSQRLLESNNMEEKNDSLTEESNTGLTPEGFDKKTYQRELMRKRRMAEKVAASEAARCNLGGTDKAFDEDKPGYYIFGEKEYERECWKRGGKFKTRLDMNKFCSPGCKDAFLDEASRSRYGQFHRRGSVAPS